MTKKIIGFLGYLFRRVDWMMLLPAIMLSAISTILLMGINDAGYVRLRVVQVQAIATVLGVLVALVITAMSYERYTSFWKYYVPLIALLNIFTAFFGEYREGTTNRSWINLGVTTIQPSEFLKLAFIISFAVHLSKARENIDKPKVLIPVLAHGAAAVGIIMLQGDTGVALIMLAIFVVMLFVSGISFKYIAVGLAAVVAALPVLWFVFLSEYQKIRILALINPEKYALNEAHQQLQGLISIGSGQIFGTGIFTDNHNYVPEMYNDFIFAFLGESLGFLGCMLVLALYAVIIYRLFRAAIRSRNYVGKYLCVGVMAMLTIQIIVNISMCLMLAPVIGVTLPLMSSGGSSVLSVYAALGIGLSVEAENSRNMFAE